MTAWKNEPWAVVDTETTGLDVERVSVWEVASYLRGGKLGGKAAVALVRPGEPIPADLVQKLGLSGTDLAHIEASPVFSADLAKRLLARLEGRLLVGYNLIHFDLPLLAAEFRRVGVDPAPLLDRPVVDVFVLCGGMLEQAKSLKLSNVAASFGVAAPKAHRSAADSRMTSDVLEALLPSLPESLEDLLAYQAEEIRRQEEDRAFFAHHVRRRPGGVYRLAFGKHKGKIVADVAREDPSFLRWAIGLRDLPVAARELFEKALAEAGQ